MRRPDFLVVGAARSGTTTLHSYLRQHPEIFLPKIKEPCFFVFEGDGEKYVKGKFAFATRNFEDYKLLFSRAELSQKIGEMSTPYLYKYEKTISTFKKYFPDFAETKIVILLRNPVERAFSQYKWRVRDGRELLSFEEAVEAEAERMKGNYSFDYFYVDRGYYFKQVKSYLENFKHVKIILFEDFYERPDIELQALCNFIGIDDSFKFSRPEKQNESSVPKSKTLGRLVTSESRLKFILWYSIPDVMRKKIRNLFSEMNERKGARLEMDTAIRGKLTQGYHEDILALEKLISRDLSGWLK
ncbi:MAG: sulfotransferase [Bacteroidota bacterium]